MAISWVSLVSFAARTIYVASQRVFIVVSVYFVIDPVRDFWYTLVWFQRINTSYVEVVALIRRVCVYVSSAKMSDLFFLEQGMNIKFCVRLGKYANDTYAVL
jgi:hypothetical protein